MRSKLARVLRVVWGWGMIKGNTPTFNIFKKNVSWVCQCCGNIYNGESKPEKCSCQEKQVELNYSDEDLRKWFL